MSLLLRLATKPAWPGASSPDFSRAVNDFALRPGERGLSVWEYGEENDEHHQLIVAALTCARFRRLGVGKIDKIDFIAIERRIVERYGGVVDTLGESPVTRANGLHRELQWPSAQLQAMARTLFDAGTSANRLSVRQVREILVQLDPTAIDDAEIRTWLEQQHRR